MRWWSANDLFGGQLTLLLDVVWKDEIFSYNPVWPTCRNTQDR
jgi:hypothetical protein